MRDRVFRCSVLLLWVAYSWSTVQSCRARSNPQAYVGDGVSTLRWVPPEGRPLIRAADERMALALDRLNDGSRPARQRLAAYREELRRAENLLVRGILADPADARALARLTAVQWELAFPVALSDRPRYVEMIRVAGVLAPTLPGVQFDVAKLLLRMGHLDEALVLFRRSLALHEDLAADVVMTLHDAGVTAPEIAARLPRGPSVLAALLPAYRLEDSLEDYLALVESSAPLTPALIESFVRACLVSGQPRRAEDWLLRLEPTTDPTLSAERELQLAHAVLTAGRAQDAFEHARRAFELQPDSARFQGFLGDFAFAGGRHDLAISAYREILGKLARSSAPAATRARFYAKIGRAEETRGRPDRAYDAYRRALELDPRETLAAEALQRFREGAGLGSRSAETTERTPR